MWKTKSVSNESDFELCVHSLQNGKKYRIPPHSFDRLYFEDANDILTFHKAADKVSKNPLILQHFLDSYVVIATEEQLTKETKRDSYRFIPTQNVDYITLPNDYFLVFSYTTDNNFLVNEAPFLQLNCNSLVRNFDASIKAPCCNNEMDKKTLTVRYKDYDNTISVRHILPLNIYFYDQWMLLAYDIDKQKDVQLVLSNMSFEVEKSVLPEHHSVLGSLFQYPNSVSLPNAPTESKNDKRDPSSEYYSPHTTPPHFMTENAWKEAKANPNYGAF